MCMKADGLFCKDYYMLDKETDLYSLSIDHSTYFKRCSFLFSWEFNAISMGGKLHNQEGKAEQR